MIFTSGAVEELSGELLVAGGVLWEAFWFHRWHSGELLGDSGELLGAPWNLFGVDLSGSRPSAAPSR